MAPITVQPNPCSIIGWMNLAQIAWAFYQLVGTPITVNAVAGAIRALQLKNDILPRGARVRGCVLFRQQTMVHPSQFQRLYDYIEERI
jgi:hypothetical protein